MGEDSSFGVSTERSYHGRDFTIFCEMKFQGHVREVTSGEFHKTEPHKKKKGISDYIVHTIERVEDGTDGEGNSISVRESGKMILCGSECISQKPRNGTGYHKACTYLDKLKCNGATLMNCGGTIYIPR